MVDDASRLLRIELLARFGRTVNPLGETREMSSEDTGEGLHIDADGKTEAANEKERLAQEEQAARETAPVPGKPSFTDMVNMLAMQAAIALGGYQGPGGENIPANPAAAKHHIDLLDVLDEKTKGNLSKEEQRVLDTVLYELRMQYVQFAGGMPAPGGPGPK